MSAVPVIVGWDIGGAHLKACLTRGGVVLDVAQWACPLWQGLDRLDQALQQARARWPALHTAVHHAVTMSGEMVDAFAHREEGVQRIAMRLTEALPGEVRLYAADAGWVAPPLAAQHWAQIASANWRATAQHAAAAWGDGLLIDIGSTTTDLIVFADGQVPTASRSDHDRLATGELVYQGVVRTPLCALAPHMPFRGRPVGVMNEWFATTADVYRLTGELDPAHDAQPTADGQPKDRAATQQRLARLIGLDARDATEHEWLQLAHAWRAAQVESIVAALLRVLQAQPLRAPAPTVVSAGCGAFLVPEIVARVPALQGAAQRAYGREVARIALGDDAEADATACAQRADWAQVCAPSVAVASLRARELR